MNKEEFDVLVNDILKVPMEEPPISAYGSINANELRQVIEAFNKIPNYDELIKDNCKKAKEIERLKNDKKKVLELIENDYFEDGSFENYYEVLNILKEGK